MKKAITVLGLGAAAVAISVSNASAMEEGQTTTSINLREQPSATSNKVSELQEGAKVKVVESNNGWANIQTEDGQSGWVSGYYVSDRDGNAVYSQTQKTQKNTENKINENKINNENSNIKTEEVNNNVKPQTNTQNNVASQQDAATNVKQSTGSETSVTSNAKIASTPSLNIRIGPSTSNSVSGVIYKGEIFKVVSKSSNGWYKVVLNDGTTGWVSGKYINLTNEDDKTNITEYNAANTANNTKNNEAQASNSGKVNSAVGLNVRSGAGTNNAVISTLANNAIVNIIGEENGWYKVRLSNGSIGYVGASYITKTSNNTSAQVNKDNSAIKKDAQQTDVNKTSTSTPSKTTATLKSSANVTNVAQSLLGTKYVWGGTSTSGFDCSGFTQYVYKNALGINIPRVSSAQATAGKSVSASNAQAGDLLYFDTTGSGRTSHVGIYLGNGKFIHASGTATKPEYVKVSSLSESWVKLLGARRF